MPHDSHNTRTTDRRSFVKASLIPAAFPLAAMLSNHAAESAEPGAVPAEPEIVDSNVHLFQWPFRELKYAQTESLIAKFVFDRTLEGMALPENPWVTSRFRGVVVLK